MKGFLTEVKNGEKDIQTALSKRPLRFDWSVEQNVEWRPMEPEREGGGEIPAFQDLILFLFCSLLLIVSFLYAFFKKNP